MSNKTNPVFLFEAILFAASSIILLPLRTIQYYSVIEKNTGFYNKIDANVIVFDAVLTVAVLFFIIAAFSKRKKISIDATPTKFPGCGILAALAAISVIYSVIVDYRSRDIDTSAYTVSSTAPAEAVARIALIQSVFGILTAVMFIVLAVLFLSGKSTNGKFRILSLAPVVWYVVRLVSRFTRTISYLRVSDLALEMLAFAFMTMFFMAFAQTSSGVEGKGNEWKLAGFGLPAALFAITCFIPRAILVLTGNSDSMYILSNADVSDLFISLFIVATILTRVVNGPGNIIVTKAAEE